MVFEPEIIGVAWISGPAEADFHFFCFADAMLPAADRASAVGRQVKAAESRYVRQRGAEQHWKGHQVDLVIG